MSTGRHEQITSITTNVLATLDGKIRMDAGSMTTVGTTGLAREVTFARNVSSLHEKSADNLSDHFSSACRRFHLFAT